jgi:hypothetical protein
MMRRISAAVCFALASVAVHAAETFKPAAISEVWVKDFESLEPERCKASDVNPSHSQAKKFFQRSKILDKKTWSDNYPTAPCQVVGTLQYRGAQCDWTISAAATGTVTCGKRTWFFACDECDALLVRKTSQRTPDASIQAAAENVKNASAVDCRMIRATRGTSAP